ncbi:MAG: HAD family hydrolase [Celeribacter sp.]
MQGRPAIRAVLFDKDGTLFDFQRTWGAAMSDLMMSLAREGGGDCARVARATGVDPVARRVLRDSPLVAGTQAETMALLRPLLAMPDHLILARMAAMAEQVVPVPAVPLAPLLDRLIAAGYQLGIATNDQEDATRQQLDALGLADRFAAIIGADSGHGAKPEPGMCRAFAAALDLRPEQVVMIGDSTHDLRAGRAAGMAVLAVLTGLAEHDDLTAEACAVLPDIGALPQWLGLPPD